MADENIFAKLREKRAEYDEIKKHIELINTKCYAYNAELKLEEDKLKALRSEIEFRKRNRDELETQYESLKASGDSSKSNEEYIKTMKTKFIKQNLSRLMHEKIPEIDKVLNNQSENEALESEFFNTVFDHVKLLFTVYDTQNPFLKLKSDDEKCFKISKKSQFSILKTQACYYWGLNDEKEYVITDDSESFIYNENQSINTFLENYSVSNNLFRLVSINTFKNRKKIFPIQEHRFRENKLSAKQKPREKKRYELTADSSTTEITKFYNEYAHIKPYLLLPDEKNIVRNIDPYAQARNIETSFWMLLLLLIFFALTIIFLFGTRDIELNKTRLDYLNSVFGNGNVHNYTTLFSYFFVNIGINLLNTKDSRKRASEEKLRNDFNLINNLMNLYPEGSFRSVNTTDNIEYLDTSRLIEYMATIKDAADYYLVSSVKIIYHKVKTENCSSNENIATILSSNDVCYSVYYKEPNILKEIALPQNMKDLVNLTKFYSGSDLGLNLQVI
jgi:hypothetical protein